MPPCDETTPRRAATRGLTSPRLRRSVTGMLAAAAGILVLFVVADFVHRVFVYRSARAHPHPSAALTVSRERSLPAIVRAVAMHMARDGYHSLPTPARDARLAASGLPIHRLRIEPRDYETLKLTADRVSAAGHSAGVAREFVPAKYFLDGRWVDIEVKLRGSMTLHYKRERPSLRLKFPSTNPYEQRQEINLLDPYDKGLTADITTSWELARHGLLEFGSKFCVLEINDAVIGCFQELEQPGRPLIDRSGRSEGFIFSATGQVFGGEGGWAWEKAKRAADRYSRCVTFARTDSVRDAISDDACPDCTWEWAIDHLDVDKFAWAGALSSLLGSSHAWARGNLRLYYDPARGKLEPIPYDYNSHRIHPGNSPVGETDGLTLFRIPSFRRMVGVRLWEVVTERVDGMVAHADSIYEALRGPLADDNHRPRNSLAAPTHQLYVDNLRANAAYLQGELRKNAIRVVARTARDGRVVAEIENGAMAFAEIRAITITTPSGREEKTFSDPIVVDGRWFDHPGRVRLEVGASTAHASEGAAGWSVALDATNGCTGAPIGANEVALVTAAGDPEGPTVASTTPPLRPLPSLPPGFRALDRAEVRVGPGRVLVDHKVEIPAGYRVVLEPGLDLVFADHAALIAYGDLEGHGTEAHPIRLHGAVSDTAWGALAVQGTRVRPSRVDIAWVEIKGGTGTENDRSYFTGPFSVTDGIVTADHCRFIDGNAIDGLNLKYCRATFTNNEVRGSKDDAVDFDFCQGLVAGNVVSKGGGDGIDFSGSDVEITRNRIFGCVDKGMSIGEHTRARIHHNMVTDCRVGVASKDGSDVVVDEMRLARLEIGIASYRKKLTFGRPRIRVEHIQMADVATSVMNGGAEEISIASSVRYVKDARRATEWPGLATRREPSPPDADFFRDFAQWTGAPTPR